jgi:hypothetical protein
LRPRHKQRQWKDNIFLSSASLDSFASISFCTCVRILSSLHRLLVFSLCYLQYLLFFRFSNIFPPFLCQMFPHISPRYIQ